MNYPLISEYIEAIKAAEDNFEELTNLRPVLTDDGLPVMTGGNFAVVFKMKDIGTGKFYALKCFTKEQEGRAEAYQQIADALKDVNSPYFVSLRYLEKELFTKLAKSWNHYIVIVHITLTEVALPRCILMMVQVTLTD